MSPPPPHTYIRTQITAAQISASYSNQTET